MILCILLLLAQAWAKPIESFDFSSNNITYEIEGEYPEYHTPTQIITTAGEIVSDYLVEAGIENVDECLGMNNLTVSYSTWSDLNVRRRQGELGQDLVGMQNIQGVYLRNRMGIGTSTIFMSNSLTRKRQVDIVLGHEIAHYWWTRLCIDEQISSVDPEAFADEIEERIRNLLIDSTQQKGN